jgi:hypothetical protein
MYIVILPDGTRHSAWETRQQAGQQVKGLLEAGYFRATRNKVPPGTVVFDRAVQAENGHYYA